MRILRFLVACEESQAVTKALRELGHEAFSNDIQECSGGHPEWHLQGDVFDFINMGWDAMIAFPPCTFLSSVQTFLCRKNENRVIERINAAHFFMKLMTADIKYIALENPAGVMRHIYREPDQTVHPYFFGDTCMKRTCLWLKNLPKLVHSRELTLFEENTYGTVPPPESTWIQKSTGKKKNFRQVNQIRLSSKERSKLSPNLAKAMAVQWSKYIIDNQSIF